MEIEIKTEEGAVFKFGTVEGFQAFVDAVKSENAKAEVDMENLPIGTLVKVVGDISGHCHGIGEILPITEVDEEDDEPAYRLDDRRVGWVAVKDIEFVSFPEEEESISGDEGLAVDEDESEIKAGDTVIATEDEFDITEGVEYEIKEFETGDLYFLDDDGDIRRVSVHEEILRKKSTKRGFKKGDVVYVDDPFCRLKKGIAEVVDGMFSPDSCLKQRESASTFQNFGDIDHTDKITLVCRAEDRLDK